MSILVGADLTREAQDLLVELLELLLLGVDVGIIVLVGDRALLLNILGEHGILALNFLDSSEEILIVELGLVGLYFELLHSKLQLLEVLGVEDDGVREPLNLLAKLEDFVLLELVLFSELFVVPGVVLVFEFLLLDEVCDLLDLLLEVEHFFLRVIVASLDLVF